MIIALILLWFVTASYVLYVLLPSLALLLRGCIGFLASNALLSFAYTAFLFFSVPFIVLQTILVVLPVLVFALTFFRSGAVIAFKPKLPLVFLFILLLFIYRFTDNFWEGSLVWGEWDGWAIWSLHAKFLSLESSYQELFSDSLAWSHPDYPLMLPSYLALLFRSYGSVNALIPAVVAYSICMVCIFSIFAAFLQKGVPVIGLVLTYILIGADILLPIGGWQYADTLLATFMCLSFILYDLYTESVNKAALLVLIGFFSAGCGWIKNEGIAFFLIFTCLFCLHNIQAKKRIFYFICGAVLPLLFIGYFKLFLVPRGDIMSSTGILDKIKDANRITIIRTVVEEFITVRNVFLVYLLLFALFFSRRYFATLGFFTLAALFITYLLIYLITPNDLEWHLYASFGRLVHQITIPLLFTIAASFTKTKSFQTLQLREDSFGGKYL